MSITSALIFMQIMQTCSEVQVVELMHLRIYKKLVSLSKPGKS